VGLDLDRDVRARWKLVEHLRLRASQQERPKERAQLHAALAVARGDGDRERLVEAGAGAEQTREDHLEEAPQLAEVVLDGRPGER
jgi:hypothetical protein